MMYSCREGPVFTKSHPLALIKSNLKLIQVKVLFAFPCFNEPFERAFLIKTRSNPDKSWPLLAVSIDLCHAAAILVLSTRSTKSKCTSTANDRPLNFTN